MILAPNFYADQGSLQRVEVFTIEQFVTKLQVEALAPLIFPRAARHDVNGLSAGVAIHSRRALAMNSVPLSDRNLAGRRAR